MEAILSHNCDRYLSHNCDRYVMGPNSYMLQICDRYFRTYILQIFYRTVTYICHISVSLLRELQIIISTIDTEWDQKVARVLLCANRTRSEIEMLGIDSQDVISATKEVLDTGTKWEDT